MVIFYGSLRDDIGEIPLFGPKGSIHIHLINIVLILSLLLTTSRAVLKSNVLTSLNKFLREPEKTIEITFYHQHGYHSFC